MIIWALEKCLWCAHKRSSCLVFVRKTQKRRMTADCREKSRRRWPAFHGLTRSGRQDITYRRHSPAHTYHTRSQPPSTHNFLFSFIIFFFVSFISYNHEILSAVFHLAMSRQSVAPPHVFVYSLAYRHGQHTLAFALPLIHSLSFHN